MRAGELGKQAGYSESLIAMVEGFHRMPTPELAKALDRAFKTPGFSENPAGPPGTPGMFGRLEPQIAQPALISVSVARPVCRRLSRRVCLSELM